MLGFIQTQVALWRFKRSPLGQALRLHTQAYFHGDGPLALFSEEAKLRLAQDFMNKLALIVDAPNGAMLLRETLAEYVIIFARLQVLSLTESEKTKAFYAANPHISGELHHRIEELAEHNEEIAEYKWQNKDASASDLIEFANGRGAVLLYYMNGLNMVRMESGDKAAKDWFRPFVEATLVREEDWYREQIGAPSLFDDAVGGLCYHAFLEYVLAGDKNPFFTFVKNFPDRYLSGEGPLPTPMPDV